MNILMKFEDSYGCNMLFSFYKNWINNNDDIELNIEDSLGTSGVFKVTKNDIKRYDYIICIFDLDDNLNYSLTGRKLLDTMKIILKDDKMKDIYRGKLILIPIFFCYETLYLYSNELKKLIRNIDKLPSNEPARLIELYRKYYDYDKINCESMYAIVDKLEGIKSGMLQIQNMTKTKDNKFYPQHFHREYEKQLMKIYFKDIVKDRGDKILVKKERDLFSEIQIRNKSDFIDKMVNDIGKYSINNLDFYKILTINNEDILKEMLLTDKKLIEMCNKLDRYNESLRGINEDIYDYIRNLDIEADYIHSSINNTAMYI